MSASDFIHAVTSVVLALLTAASLARVGRRRSLGAGHHIAIAALFMLFLLAVVARSLDSLTEPIVPEQSALDEALVLAIPALLLRVVDGLTAVSGAVMRVAWVGLLLAVVSLLVFGEPNDAV